MFRDNIDILFKVFEGISLCLVTHKDLSVSLVATQTLIDIGEKLIKNQYNDLELLNKVIYRLIDLIDLTSEDTISIPIECLTIISKLNKEAALTVPLKASKKIIALYSNHYNHPIIGSKLLQIIRLWCEDERCSKLMIHLFIPFVVNVFDDFFKSLKGSGNNNFEEIKKTVITEHGGDIDVKTNLDMLPVSIFKLRI